MKTLKLNKKGVSPIIATLLLIVIAVAAAVVTYSFVMGFLTPGGTTTPQGVLSVDSYNFASNVDESLTVYVRNSGQTVTCSAIYVNGTLLQTGYTVNSGANTFPAGSAVPLVISNTNSWTTGQNTIKIVCTDATQREFNVNKP